VADTHLWSLSIGWTGWQAVFGFYTLSGYLMTRVLHERYGFARPGIAAFLANRLLRLWPAYLVVIAVTWATLHFYPLAGFFFSLTEPHTVLEKVTNGTILGQVGFDFKYLLPLSRLSPTSWSLSIELFCYCLLAFYFAKTPGRLTMLAVLGLAAILSSTGYCWAEDPAPYGPYCFQNRYGVLQAGFIPFAVGGLAYFHRPAMLRWLIAYWKWAGFALLCAEALVAVSLFASVTIGPYLGVPAMLALVVWDGGDKRPSAAADFVGRASYHLFIAHMSIAAILVVVFAGIPNSFPVFALSVAIALMMSAFLVPLEWWLNRLRSRVSQWGRQRAVAACPPECPAVADAAGRTLAASSLDAAH
jgi:peptidoglycan/LPS O-acetylase OafA/YrhL